MSKIYPNLDYVSEDSRDYKKHEINCGQIFSKGTAITRDILEKLEETEIGPKHTVICGQEFNTRQLWVLTGLMLLFLSSCMGVTLMFGTCMFDSYVLTGLTISNSSDTYQKWKGPYVSTLIKVYIFNYTNVDEYERGNAEKLHVEEIGPFVYEEFVSKVNIKFHDNDTVSYQEQRTHKYRADLSKGRRQSDRVIVPNMPLMGAAAASENAYYFSRVAMSTLLSGLDSKPFLSLPAHKFIWGYDDNFYTLVKGVMSFDKQMPYEKIGLLTSRNGTSPDVVTLNTGKNDINKVGQIDNFNGQNKLDYWSAEECNKIQASDGMFFPPYTVRQKKAVHVYFKELCRRFPMVYEKEVKLLNGKVPAYKYVMPDSVFDSPDSNSENQCFCDMESGSCAPQGLFNSTPCAFGVPAFISFPHFYKADPAIRNAISGLNPNYENHESYLNIHPTLGFVISGISRLQMNVQVKKSFGMSQLDMFEDDMMLPISWMDMGIETDNLPDYAKDNIYSVATTIPMVETLLKVAFLLTTLVTLLSIVIVLYGKYRQRVRQLGKLKRSNSSWSREEESIS